MYTRLSLIDAALTLSTGSPWAWVQIASPLHFRLLTLTFDDDGAS